MYRDEPGCSVKRHTPPAAHRVDHKLTPHDAPSLRKAASDVPRDLDTIVFKCLAYEAKDRYATTGGTQPCRLGHPALLFGIGSAEQQTTRVIGRFLTGAALNSLRDATGANPSPRFVLIGGGLLDPRHPRSVPPRKWTTTNQRRHT